MKYYCSSAKPYMFVINIATVLLIAAISRISISCINFFVP